MARPRKEDTLDIAPRAVAEMVRLLAARDDFDVPLVAVAQAVGCTPPALYGYFRNKAALLRAAREEGFNRLYTEKLTLSERMRTDPFGYLREGSYAYVRFALDNPTLYRLMFAPPPNIGAGDDPLSGDLGRRVFDLLLAGLRGCQTQGFLPGMDIDRYAFMFWSSVHGAVCLCIQNRVLDETAKWETVRDVVDTLMRMIAATAPGHLHRSI